MKNWIGFLSLSLATSTVCFAEDAYLESDGTQAILTDLADASALGSSVYGLTGRVYLCYTLVK